MNGIRPISIFSGMSNTALQQALSAAQQAYIEISTGTKGESFSYSQGDGARAVTYSKANIAELAALIRQLQVELGIIKHARRPLRFKY